MPCRNVGGIDRAARLTAGVALLATALVLAATGRAHASTIATVGALLLVSGVLGFCPPYALLGISTIRRRSDPGETLDAPSSGAIAASSRSTPKGRTWTRTLDTLLLAAVAAVLVTFAHRLWKPATVVESEPANQVSRNDRLTLSTRRP